MYAIVDRQPPFGADFELDENDDFTLADSYTLAGDLTFERSNPDSVRNCFALGRENARQMRHCISAEMWTCLNLAWLRIRDLDIEDIWKDSPESFYARTTREIETFAGVAEATMYRDEGWRFMRLGLFIERAQLLAALLLAQIATERALDTAPETGWTSLLRAVRAFDAYRSRYGVEVRPDRVLELLATDPQLPGSLYRSLEALASELAAIGPAPDARSGAAAERLAGRLCALIRYEWPDGGDQAALLARARLALLEAPRPGERGITSTTTPRTRRCTDAMGEAVRYDIEHVSRYRYTSPVRQCAMLLCLEPRADRGQRLIHFDIETRPPGGLNRERDSFGNTRHMLDVPRVERVLEITARSTVESTPPAPLPERLGHGAWDEIGALGSSFADWDFMHPSVLIRPSPALAAFTDRHGIEPGADPLESLLRLSDTLHRRLRYIPGATTAESPVDHALRTDQGVLPGLRPRHDRHRAHLGHPRALRLRLPARDRQAGRALAGQRHPRLGRVPAAGARVDRIRSHQLQPGRRRACPDRDGARLSRRVSDQGHHSRRRDCASRGRREDACRDGGTRQTTGGPRDRDPNGPRTVTAGPQPACDRMNVRRCPRSPTRLFFPR